MIKPRIFIGSSSESYNVASSCNVSLDRVAEVTLWPRIFDQGSSTLESLIKKASNVDFALFIFNPDDLGEMRNESKRLVRDNVLFELGVFIGSLGKERCFILKPRGVEMHMPSDLLGFNTSDYDPYRSDDDLDSAVNAACASYTKTMRELGFFSKKERDAVVAISNSTAPIDSTLDRTQLQILAILLSSHTESACLSSYEIQSKKDQLGIPNQEMREHKKQIALIKLIKLQLVEKVLAYDESYNGAEYVGYKITNDGIDYVLENERYVDKAIEPLSQPEQKLVTF